MSQGHGFFRADLPTAETGDAGLCCHDRHGFLHHERLDRTLIYTGTQKPDEIALEKHFAKFQKAALGDRFQKKGNRDLEGLGLSVIIGCLCAYFLGRKTEKMKPADILRQL